MRRKFLYFKIYDLKEHPKEIETFSQLELENLIGDVEPIDNVFQLSKQPEVKRILEKDINLQNALTDSLPRRGRHGYLWIGDNLPDVVNALSRLSYIKEVFLFQQLLEPEPDFIKQRLKNMTFLEFDINLWRVYKFWTFSYFLNRTLYIGTISKTESEIDEHFKTFRDELKLAPGKLVDTDPSQMISFVQDSPIKNLNLDQRNQNDSQLNNRWLHALINTISKSENDQLFNPFSGNGSVLIESLLAGVNITSNDLNPVQAIMSEANGSLIKLDIQEYNRLVTELHSKIKMLMSASAATQTDLFLYSAEGQFLNFWETEKKRFKSLGLNPQVEAIQKQIAATRFLIQTKAITKSTEINALFNSALINLIAQAIRKKEKLNFGEIFSKALHDIYLKLYLIKKLRSFYTPDFGTAIVENKSNYEAVNNESFNGVIAFMPFRISRNGFEKDRLIVEMLNLHGAVTKLEHALVGSKYIKAEDREKLQNEITNHDGFYKLISKEGHDVLSRLELMGKQEEVLRYYLLWKQYFGIFKEFYNSVEMDSNICLMMENPSIKVDKTAISIQSSQVLLSCIENDETISTKLLTAFSKNIPQAKLIYKKEIQILLFEKVD
ncbi:MAG: hypothetical protein D8M58_09075 [Calditrichaeota bacterium]|nr:MAG: hypothetical protein DWQ03_17415 [Calditrichota bacterium]MBL1205537.1 hypothetical protein [Calditrichota bacterium]NOG45366.1 hypothetical protein [Calditrichota bacterium]